MRSKLSLTVAAGICFCSAVGHTVGHFFIPDLNGEALRSTYAIMENTVYPIPFGQSQNLLAFRHGSNLSLTVFLLLMGVQFLLLSKQNLNEGFSKNVLLTLSLSIAAVAILSAFFFFFASTLALVSASLIGLWVWKTSAR